MGDIFNAILAPIEWLVAWIMYGFHQALTAIGLDPASGWTWSLSIVGLVVVMRAAMIPLFVRQIMASRKMQMIQPELQKIQKKYKGKSDPESRQAMTQETMELYKKEGTNPFSSCLPILVQSPFFFGLFRVLNGLDEVASGATEAIGPITQPVAEQFEQATIFGASLSATFLGSTSLNVKIVTTVLIILMSATTFLTQRQLMTKNMPASALDNPFAKQQKLLSVHPPDRLRGVRRQLPHRCPHLLVHDERVVDVPAVLCHPADAGSRLVRREGVPRAPREEGQADPRRRWCGDRRGGRCCRGRGGGQAIGAASAAHLQEAQEVQARRPEGAGQAPRWQDAAPTSRTFPVTAGEPMSETHTQDALETEESAAPGTIDVVREEGEEEAPTDDLTVEDDDSVPEAERSASGRRGQLEKEGEAAADFLETLLDICDLDGDIDVDIDGDRAVVSVVDSEEGRVPRRLVGPNGQVLDALQELTRLAVQSATGERSRLMLDVAGHRAERREALVAVAEEAINEVRSTGERKPLSPMTAFERKVVHDEVLAAGLVSESEGTEPRRFVVILPA